MGLNTSGGMDLAPSVLTVNYTSASGTGSSASFIPMSGKFNATLSGTWTGATMELQRSFDGASTWVPATTDSVGTKADYTANASVVVDEPEPGIFYRWQPTVAVSTGTAVTRISGGMRLT